MLADPMQHYNNKTVDFDITKNECAEKQAVQFSTPVPCKVLNNALTFTIKTLLKPPYKLGFAQCGQRPQANRKCKK